MTSQGAVAGDAAAAGSPEHTRALLSSSRGKPEAIANVTKVLRTKLAAEFGRSNGY